MPVDVKICGLSTEASIDAAIAAGTDYVGLVFYPKSPRNVSLTRAAQLAAHARGRARIVALAVDPDDRLLSDILAAADPDIFQLHGDETPERVADIRRKTGKQVFKALKIGSSSDVQKARDYAGVADLILFDAKAPESLRDALPGGNGVPFDWSLLADGGQSRFMLSGGLTPENVAEAIGMTHAPAVDVSSGVESAPGVKDLGLIRKFIEAAKAAS